MTDLAEAEGRELKRSVRRAGWSLACLLVMGLLTALGLGFCLWAGYQYLAVQLGDTKAVLAAGIFTLFLAGGFAWLAIRIGR